MYQEFNSARNYYFDRDSKGVVRQILHTHAPVAVAASTPQLAAASYLKQYGQVFGVADAQLAKLGLSPSKVLEDAPVEYRFELEKKQFDSATVAFYQTLYGLPVWQAGIAVQLQGSPFRVLTAQSSLHPDLEAKKPTAAQLKAAQALNAQELARLLGVSGDKRTVAGKSGVKGLAIERTELVIYRYEEEKRLPVPPPPVIGVREETITPHAAQPTLPVGAVADSIKDGQHYVALKVNFQLPFEGIETLYWTAILDVATLSVLFLRAHIDDVNGMVFEDDPVTTNGGPMPSASSAALNPVRVSRTLAGLDAPSNGTQPLSGNNIKIVDNEAPTAAPPTVTPGNDFNFDARTNDFAAVNGYYHADKFFRLLDGMGFTQSGYFGGTSFPTPVDHRGHFGTSNGIEVNAYCAGTSDGSGILRTNFMLADTGDTSNPIGITGDYRVVLHELGGHGVLYNHVSSANFGFSHSAGDSVAAILNDPGTQAADRFQTFPWVYNTINRRHDRTLADGWGWAGNIALHPFSSTYDSGGYNNEQILATTHFRIYRSIGGDSADLPTKQFAARMTVYLILRAIATLTPSTNPDNAATWAGALTTADLGDWVSENITGGAYGKVIRWAFEKQGLFQPAGTATPNNNAGAPPAVDVYVDDGRGGEYTYQPNYWSNQSIWNRLAPDGGTTFQTPVTNQTNYAYVRIKNRGTQTATNVVVKAFHANPAAGLSYPIDWTPMTTTQLSAADVPANNGGDVIVGPFAWTPTHVGHECIFMIVSANGDSSNVDNIQGGDSIPEWRLVPNDNNIGQRNVFPVSGGGTSGLTSDFNQLTYRMKNPHLTPAMVEVRPVLPKFLVERGWKVEFLNEGGQSFTLPAGESRQMIIRLAPGADFTASDVPPSEDATIHLNGYAGGILVGGMSYTVDPNQKPLPVPGRESGQCAEIGSELLKCICLPHGKVDKVHLRKVTIDLEFKDDCGCGD